MNLSRRKCPQCGSEMFEPAYIHHHNMMLYLGTGFKVRRLGCIKAHVCPECGEIGIHFEDINKLKYWIGKWEERQDL